MLLAMWLLAAQPGRAIAAPARIGGTFIQLTRAHASWTDAQWQGLFAQFRTMGLTELVVQWSIYDEVSFHRTADGAAASRAPLPTILQLADHAGIQVLVGLVEDPAYWSRIKRDPALVEVYLQRLRLRSERAARDLLPLVRTHPSFAGWYISQEVDDVSWHTDAAWRVLGRYVRGLSSALRQLTPSARIAISAFSNGFVDPDRLAARWATLACDADLEVMLQDGIGAGKLTPGDAERYEAAIHAALDNRARFHIIVEAFARSTDRPDAIGGPAPLRRLLDQLALAARYTTEPILVFSVPDYMSPAAGRDAAELYEGYLQAISGR